VPAGGPRWPGPGYVKRRGRPAPGSIPEVLDIFRAEVRFYLQIAPVAGVRVPACYRADTPAGSAEASAWIGRLEAADHRLGAAWPA
jgi:hypothetical protein